MADLPETPGWEASIKQLEQDDMAEGGLGGVANVQATQLANRTLFLKNNVDIIRDLTMSSGTGAYRSIEEAQDAIDRGEETRETFLVEGSGDVWIARYANVNGVATPTGDAMSSSQALNNLPARLTPGNNLFLVNDVNGIKALILDGRSRLWLVGLDADLVTCVNRFKTQLSTIGEQFFYEPGSNLFVHRDVNNQVVFKFNRKGDFFIPNLGTSVQDAIKKCINSINNQGAESQVGISAKFIDFAMIQEKVPVETGIRLLSAVETGADQVRIPSLLRVGKNEFIVFFESRGSLINHPEARDYDFGPNDIMMKRFCVDSLTKQFTFESVKMIAEHFIDSVDGYEYSCINACTVRLDNKRLLLLYVERRIGVVPMGKHHRFVKRYSDDNGQTWSERIDLSSSFPLDEWNVLAPGPGLAIVKRYGRNKGRIIVPAWHASSLYPESGGQAFYRAGMLYSDDNGESFQIGPFHNESTNEVQCAENESGDIVFIMRTNNGRILTIVKDGTLTMEPLPNNGSFGIALMAGLIQNENDFDGSSPKLQVIGAYGKLKPTDSERSNLMIHTSYNGGSEWLSPYHVDKENSALVGYSGISSLTPLYKVVLWETNSYRELQARIISMKNILED